jgi:agmatinase
MVFDPNAAALPGSGIFGLADTPDEAKVVLLPVPWDATTSYRAGAAKGPAAILEASKQVDLFDIETGKPYESGIALLDESDEIRAWNVEARMLALEVLAVGGRVEGNPKLTAALSRVNALGALVNDRVHATAKKWIEAGKVVGLIGGDHAAPYGSIRAHAEAYPGMGVLHVDAHADLRLAYEGFEWSHASIMESVSRRLPSISKIVQVGIRDLCEEEFDRIYASNGRIETHYDADLARARMRGVLHEKIATIAAALPEKVYVTFDIDGLDPTLCPSTGTPVPGGLSFHEATAILRALAEAGHTIVGFDLNEVAPSPEGEDEWDGNVGARVLYKLIGWTLKSRGSLDVAR